MSAQQTQCAEGEKGGMLRGGWARGSVRQLDTKKEQAGRRFRGKNGFGEEQVVQAADKGLRQVQYREYQ